MDFIKITILAGILSSSYLAYAGPQSETVSDNSPAVYDSYNPLNYPTTARILEENYEVFSNVRVDLISHDYYLPKKGEIHFTADFTSRNTAFEREIHIDGLDYICLFDREISEDGRYPIFDIHDCSAVSKNGRKDTTSTVKLIDLVNRFYDRLDNRGRVRVNMDLYLEKKSL
ncbi:MAG: hypothetical protein OXB84_05600 [Halobacteriovoraceae bacterium]|nr:hypothetical protein [Halobacteriovoraceae bacterium]